jgi:hypothetical protein
LSVVSYFEENRASVNIKQRILLVDKDIRVIRKNNKNGIFLSFSRAKAKKKVLVKKKKEYINKLMLFRRNSRLNW